MASLASVATLGSARSNSSVCDGFPVTICRTSVFRGSSFIHFAPRWSEDYPLRSARSNSSVCDGSPVPIHRTFVFRGSSFIHFAPRWSKDYPWVCKCSTVTTELIAELGNSIPPVSTFRGSKDDDSDLILKPSPKPILKAPPKPEPILTVNSRNSVPWAPTKPGRDPLDRKPDKVEDRERVIESLGEVLEKAEKLENATPTNIDIIESSISAKPTLSADVSPTEGKPSISAGPRKSKTLKSVWRKGNPVSSMQKVVKGASNFGRESIKIQEPEKSKVPPRAPLKPQPKLQAKPAAAIPPVIKKPVILKDVGATPRPPVSEVSVPSMKVKDRKPILIDKFAPKKPADDPLINQVVLPPVKPAKGSSQQKLKDEKRKKAGATGGLRRRLKDEDVVPDDETSELNVSIPGAVARKGRKWSKASRKAARLEAAKAAAPVKADILEVGEGGMMTEDLAYNLAISEVDILGFLYSKGLRPDTVFALDKDIVKMVCNEYDVEVIETDPVKVEDMAKKKKALDEEDMDALEERPPVLTIMGHVDHGKTTLLDYIRKSRVAASEAGGITQGIGAYKVLVPADGKLQPCVFLDTPGHEAFGAMRARGARVTDIAIIVVAADDGVRPQTKEAIAHAKAAQVPIVVAINKIDKEGASPERVMKELSDAGLMPEDWGGDVPMVQISALKGEKVDDLLETVMLHAEFQELKANPKRSAKGTVIEAGLDKSRGPVATFIVQNGTLKKGDVVICGEAFGKVRALFDDRGAQVDDAGPSTAVQIIGLNNVPIAGDEFEVVGSLDTAREKAETRAEQLRAERISAKAGEGKVTLSSIASAVSAGKQPGLDMHQLNIILKVDVQGSIEAIRQAIQMLPQDNVTLKFLMQAPGDVSTSDVDLAVAAEAIIFGFNIKVPGSVKKYADNKGIEIRNYRVIYELIDDMRKAMEGLLEPVEEKVPIGRAEVRAIFTSGSGRVAGCMVTEGKVVKGCGLQVVRNGKTVYTGILESLRRVKEMVKEVAVGLECGIGVEDYDDWEEGDIIETFDTVKKQRTLEEASASVAAALAKAGVGR